MYFGFVKKTPLFLSHKAKGARFISFAGWQMPFSYTNPKAEHLQTRHTGGLFDVSHMGQIRIKGQNSFPFLERLLPSSLKSLEGGQALYSVLCLENGGLIDDLILYAFSKKDCLLCVNAGTKDKDLNWIKSQLKKENVSIQDESDDWALIAVQGPRSFELCSAVFPSIKKIPRFHFIEREGCLFARTGYTGEKGFEIYIPSSQADLFWERFLKKGRDFSIGPVGLGARDTLRLEMAYLLSGQDFDETKSPLQAGLSWLINSEADYVGRLALFKQKKEGNNLKLKGFIVEEPSGVPRKGCLLYSKNGNLVGEVTSGAKSPSLEKMIGLAYIQKGIEEFYVDIRGSQARACLAPTPFLKQKP